MMVFRISGPRALATFMGIAGVSNVGSGCSSPSAIQLEVEVRGAQTNQVVAIGVNDFVVASAAPGRDCDFDRVHIGNDRHVTVTRLASHTFDCGAIAGAEGVLYVMHGNEHGRPTAVTRVDFRNAAPNIAEVPFVVVGRAPVAEPYRLLAVSAVELWHIDDAVYRSRDGGASWEALQVPGIKGDAFTRATADATGTLISSGALVRIAVDGITHIDTDGYHVTTLHGSIVGGERGDTRAVGVVEGTRIRWEPLSDKAEAVLLAWKVGATLRLVSHTWANGGDPRYRVRRGADGTWSDVTLKGASPPFLAPYAVDPEGNVIVPRRDEGLWYLPAID